ncbi:MAG: transglycosylase SLT domain-containing protein [Acidobacteriaceae bacterium]
MQMNLLFNLEAEDTAQTAFSDLLDTVTKLQAVLEDLGATDIADLLGQVQDLAVAFQDAGEAAQKVQDAINAAMGNATDATDAAMGSVDSLKTSLTEVADTTLGAVSDQMAAVMDATTAADEQVLALKDDLASVDAINMTSAADSITQITDALTTANAQAAELKANLMDTGAGGAGTTSTSSTSGGKSIFAGLGSGLFQTAMYSLMGYMGLQAMSSSANLFATMQTFMADNPGMTPTDAERAMAMLGSQGITGSAATGMMSSLGGKTMQDLFTLNGMLSPQGIQLQSLGLNRSMLTGTPWMNMQTIGTLYRQLNAKGLGMDAMNLLSLTGTSSLQNMFTNWGALQSGVSSMNMNMTPQQIAQQAATGQTFSLDLQKLAFAFSQLTVDLIPLIQPLVQGFTDLLGVFSGKMSIGAALKDLNNSLSEAQKMLLGFVAGLVGIKIVNLLRGMFSAVGTMEVTAGVVNILGGKMPGSGPVPTDPNAPTTPTDTTPSGPIAEAAAAILTAIETILLSPATALVAFAGGVVYLDLKFKTAMAGLDGLMKSFDKAGWAIQLIESPIAATILLFKGFLAVIHAVLTAFAYVTPGTKQFGDALEFVATTLKTVLADIGKWPGEFVKAIAGALASAVSAVATWGVDFKKAVVLAFSTVVSGIEGVLAPLLKLLGIGSSPSTGGGSTTTTTTQTTQQTIAQLNTQIAGLSSQFESYQKAHPGSNMNNNATLAGYHTQADALRTQITALSAALVHTQAPPGSGASSPSSNVMTWVQQALGQMGAGISSEWGNIMSSLAMKESGGNPNAVNGQGVQYYANNPSSIEHAMGLMQMMPSTFAANSKGGGSIFNPLDNIMASMNYILGRYHTPANFMAQTGFGTANYKGYAYGGTISEPIMGLGLASGMGYMFGENGPEHFSPAGGGGASATGAINLTVNINAGATSNPQQLARMVSQEIMMKLKTRMNTDLSF